MGLVSARYVARIENAGYDRSLLQARRHSYGYLTMLWLIFGSLIVFVVGLHAWLAYQLHRQHAGP